MFQCVYVWVVGGSAADRQTVAKWYYMADKLIHNKNGVIVG